ncbi:hypothetical protein Tco_0084546 [Tanacetum coccineum]
MTYEEHEQTKQQIVDTKHYRHQRIRRHEKIIVTTNSINLRNISLRSKDLALRRARKPSGAGVYSVVEETIGQVLRTCEEPTGRYPTCDKPWSSPLRRVEEPSGQLTSARKFVVKSRYDVRGTVGAVLRRARKLGQSLSRHAMNRGHVYRARKQGQVATTCGERRGRRGRFTSCEEPWSSRYDVRGTVGAGLRRASNLGQVATTCEEPSGQVYDVRVTLVKSLRRARNRRGSRYDVRGTVGAGLRRARKVGQVATTCEEPSGQVYVVRGNLVKSLRRARNRRGRFTTCEEPWSSRYDVRGNVGAGLRRARKLGQVATTCEEPSGQVYVVRGNLVKSGIRRAEEP